VDHLAAAEAAAVKRNILTAACDSYFWNHRPFFAQS
jgi:hypothetical protein